MHDFLSRLGLEQINSGVATKGGFIEAHGSLIDSYNPTTGEVIAQVQIASVEDYERVMVEGEKAFKKWRMVPAPKRGEIIREVAVALREHKEDLGRLITLEVGKLLSEGLGEVQESIDMADFSVGLSRQLYGLAMHSERPNHRMYEQWHPLGIVGVITAFNFPNAVWAWNTMVAAACGDVVVWKPSRKAMLTAIATHRIAADVFERHGHGGVLNLMCSSSRDVGELMLHDRRIPQISATASCAVGRRVGKATADRLSRCILELGGNNAVIVHHDADLGLALRAVAFGAVGTTGQRCTSTRRLFLHNDIADEFIQKLVSAYGSMTIGDPMEADVLVGPLVSEGAVVDYEKAIECIKNEGGEILIGGHTIDRPGYYVAPTIVKAHMGMEIAREETFAPILYVFTYSNLEDAIEGQNSVDQGLSSSIFTSSFYASETFLSHAGSDCGIANVNLGTSGAEIGGAFGGEKDTGGGREAGSDSWKAYMRRQTCTMNWGNDLPLAQGVKFDI